MRQEYPKILTAVQYRYLLAALFITGAVTLVLEIAGTRLISPYYGSSIYTWSALITVTLVALAGGYALGGRQADSKASLLLFSRNVGLAGLFVAAAPLMRNQVLSATSPLGVQWGALASATVLLAPALSTLGTLGPLAIRLTASAVTVVGRSAGRVYAVSTLGSVGGAIAAGFLLIPHLALSHIFYACALALILLGAWGQYLSAQRVPLREAAAAAALAFALLRPHASTQTNIRLQRESAYGQIKVLDVAGPAEESQRYLMVNGTSQSIAKIPSQRGLPFESDSAYIHTLELTALVAPKPGRALVIGLGAGLLPSALEREHGIVTDSVELDPAILDTARGHFGFSSQGEVIVSDGRLALERSTRRYSIIVLDAFGSEQPPFHLFTLEAFRRIRGALQPGGVFAVNLVGVLRKPGDEAWLSAYKTLASVFPEVKAYQVSPDYLGMANINFFCSLDALPMDRVLARARPFIKEDAAFMLGHELAPSGEDMARATVLTDDFAPLEALLAQTVVRWRRSLQQNIGDVLLY